MTPRTILITGSTDGIGELTARTLVERGHTVLLHGRNPSKLDRVAASLGGDVERHVADLSGLDAVEAMAAAITARHDRLDVLINNAGVFKTRQPRTADGLDVRFMVNTIAPYVLTRRLLPLIPADGRVVNLSSAAQAPVDVQAMTHFTPMGDMEAYAQSKLGITIWSAEMAAGLPDGPAIIAVNPGSLLASKMVKEGFGVAGNDLNVGADILIRAALSPEFAQASGQYFDNDSERFAPPHHAASDAGHVAAFMQALNAIVEPA